MTYLKYIGVSPPSFRRSTTTTAIPLLIKDLSLHLRPRHKTLKNSQARTQDAKAVFLRSSVADLHYFNMVT